MKKIFLAMVILLGCLTANAQNWFPVGEVNAHHFGFGIQAGSLGMGKEVTRFGLGANLLAYGVYLDGLYSAPEHRSDPKMGVWDDSSAFSVHIGYQVPILEWLRIIPIIGYAEVSRGTTDGTDYNYEYSTSSHQWIINNKYTKSWKNGGFDAGGSLVVNLGPVNLFVTGTMSSVYGGIGVEF